MCLCYLFPLQILQMREEMPHQRWESTREKMCKRVLCQLGNTICNHCNKMMFSKFLLTCFLLFPVWNIRKLPIASDLWVFFLFVTFCWFVFGLTGSEHRHVSGHEKNYRPSRNWPQRGDDVQKGAITPRLAATFFFLFLFPSWIKKNLFRL